MADKRIQDLPSASSVGLADLLVLEQSGAAKSVSGQILVNDLAAALDGHGGINSITYTPPVSPSLNGTLTITMADETVYTLSVTNGRGIASVTGPVVSGLAKTYSINYNDGSSPTTITLYDGRGIVSISDPVVSGLTKTYTVNYNDGTTSTIVVTDGKEIVSWSESVSGLTRTITIAYNDGSEDEIEVEDGRSIDSITWVESGTPGDGMLHTGTIAYNDGTESTIVIQDGVKGDPGDQAFVWFKWSADYPTSDGDISDSVNAYIGIY